MRGREGGRERESERESERERERKRERERATANGCPTEMCKVVRFPHGLASVYHFLCSSTG